MSDTGPKRNAGLSPAEFGERSQGRAIKDGLGRPKAEPQRRSVDRSEPEDKVGYGRPPKHTRFEKGLSGNPFGRPRGAKNKTTANGRSAKNGKRSKGRVSEETDLSELILRQVNRRVNCDEQDHEGAKTRMDVIVESLVAQAEAGDLRAIRFVLEHGFGAGRGRSDGLASAGRKDGKNRNGQPSQVGESDKPEQTTAERLADLRRAQKKFEEVLQRHKETDFRKHAPYTVERRERQMRSAEIQLRYISAAIDLLELREAEEADQERGRKPRQGDDQR